MTELSLEWVLSNISDYTNDAIVICDAEPINEPGPVIVFTNPTFTHITGYHASEVIGKSPRLLQGPGTSQVARREIQNALKAWRPVVTEVLNYKKDGTPFWSELSIVPVADDAGSYRYWISIQRDTTELRHHQRDLTLRSLAMDASLNAIAVCELKGDRLKVIYGNKPFAQLMGGDPRAEERDFLDLFPGDVRSKVFEALSRSSATGIADLLEVRLSPPGGGAMDVRLSIESIPPELGGDRMLLVSIRDVTEEHAQKKEIAEAQRLRAVGQVTGGVAHDFNNLLTIVLHCSEILLTDDSLNEDTRSLIQTIADTADRGSSLTGQLLSFARRQPLESEHIDVVSFLNRTKEILERVLPSTLEIELSIETDVSGLRADPMQLGTALLNLAINARDATKSRGVICLAAANRIVDKRSSGASDLREGRYVSLSVIDDGPGMSPDVLQRAFEPFFTTKDVGEGSGLGLSMVYGFARQSGGDARIISSSGAGTTVELLLPYSDDQPIEAKGGMSNDGSVDFSSIVVLVVEDNAGVREQVSKLVRAIGCKTYVAGNANEAMRLLEDHQDVDLLFTDIVMAGGMSGVELAREARTLKPDLKVLFTSGYSDEDPDVMMVLSDGAPLLKKPYRRIDLMQALTRTVLGY
jgi:PAS domain S-box-containing protein